MGGLCPRCGWLLENCAGALLGEACGVSSAAVCNGWTPINVELHTWHSAQDSQPVIAPAASSGAFSSAAAIIIGMPAQSLWPLSWWVAWGVACPDCGAMLCRASVVMAMACGIAPPPNCMPAMEIAIASPIQPRRGSRTIIRASSNVRMQ